MTAALHVVFWVWCGALVVIGLISYACARGLSGESGGPVFVALSGLCALLLALSVALRVLL